MPKLIRVFDPDEPERRINLVIAEATCPGALEFLAEMPYRTETPLIRGVLYQWFIKHRDAGTLDDAIEEALAGPGGLIESAPHDKQVRRGAKGRSARVLKPRAISARPAARPATPSQVAVAPAEQPPPLRETVVEPIQPLLAQGVEEAETPATIVPPAIAVAANPGTVPATQPAPASPQSFDPVALEALEKLGDMFG